MADEPESLTHLLREIQSEMQEGFEKAFVDIAELRQQLARDVSELQVAIAATRTDIGVIKEGVEDLSERLQTVEGRLNMVDSRLARIEKHTGACEGVIPWDVVEVKIVGEHLIAVTFADGLRGKVHMGRLIHSKHAGVFERLRDPSVFKQVHIEHGTLVWPGEIDLSPHVMHDEIERHGIYVP